MGDKQTPTGTFTSGQNGPAPKPAYKAYGCGCIHRQVLILILAMIYLSIGVLAGIAVWAGIDANQTHYNGLVKIDLSNYTVTKVTSSTPLDLSIGWLKYKDGTRGTGLRDLSNLSVGAAILGFFMAFILLVSFIIATWKFLTSCCIRKGHHSGGTCAYILLGVVAIAFQFSFLIVTSRDMDNYAHSKLGVKAENDIAMAPGYAWNCGTSAAFLWLLAAIFNACIPTKSEQDFHKF